MQAAKIAQFWNWFTENAARLAKFETDQARLATEITQALRRLHQPEGYTGRGPSLAFDMAPRREGTREFVVSADAISPAFHLARELVAAAPALHGWKFTALIQRRAIEKILAQCKMGADDVWVRTQREGNFVNISVFVRNIRASFEEDISEMRSFLIYVLGEETFGTRVGTFDCQELPSDPTTWNLRPLRELPDMIDNEKIS
jgi:hypothetical protein